MRLTSSQACANFGRKSYEVLLN